LFTELNPYLEAEIIYLALEILKAPFNLKNFPENIYTLEINSLGCPKCRKEYKKVLLKFLRENKTNLCETCQQRIEKNPLRILDCKVESCNKIIAYTPTITTYLCEECEVHFEELKKIKEKTNEETKIIAQKILLETCQKIALPVAKEHSISFVEIPHDDFKRKLIGRKGRNIHLLENLTGTEIIVDDTPKKIFIFSFNPKRRITAKLLIEKIINENEISAETIEKSFQKTLEELERKILQTGLETCKELGIANFSEELLKKIGEMEFYVTYGQNLLAHSKEVAIISKNLALNFDIDPTNVLKAGLLHDIGKILSGEENLPHQISGANFVKKFGENEAVIQAIINHHQLDNFSSLESFLVSLANGLSHIYGAGRTIDFTETFKRLIKIEELCQEIQEVKRAYAFQLGREIRILLNVDKLSEKESNLLIRNLQQKIRHETNMLGEIKINLIYEL